MTKKSFIAMMLYVFSGLFLVMGIVLMSTQEQKNAIFWLGDVLLFLFIAGTIAASIVIAPRRAHKERKPINKQKLLKVLLTVIISAILVSVGITLMVLVHWIAGYPCILLAIITMLFLIPILKGFKAEEKPKEPIEK